MKWRNSTAHRSMKVAYVFRISEGCWIKCNLINEWSNSDLVGFAVQAIYRYKLISKSRTQLNTVLCDYNSVTFAVLMGI